MHAKILVGQLIVPHLIINPEHEAFVNGHYIIDNVLLIQEFMHDLQHAPI